MGRGSYTSNDWNRLKTDRNISAQSTVNDLYRSQNMKDQLNPYHVKYRESCDSMDNPASTAIIIGLDVTGSMGYLSEEIAKNSLNRTMNEIYAKDPVSNPHIMFMAIGDSKSDEAPLQVTQFEADIRIAEQLLDIYFEGHGGGNGGESYLLAWYFAARHTRIDCYEKRHQKGFLFTIGDECCHKDLTVGESTNFFGDISADPAKEKNPENLLQRIFGKGDTGVIRDYTSKELFDEASEKYEIFHIVLKAGAYEYQHSGAAWKELIGNRAIELDPKDLDKLPELLISLMQAAGGKPAREISNEWPGEVSAVVMEAIHDFLPDGEKGMLNF